MSRLIPVLVATLLIGACSAESPPPQTATPAIGQSTPTAAGIEQPVEPRITSAPPNFTDGRHIVDEDLAPGTYRAVALFEDPAAFCYWERLSGLGGTEAEVIANSAGIGSRVVTIAPTDAAFLSADCGTWTAVLRDVAGGITDGVWIVGIDLEPGTYQAEGGPLCYWQRLSGFGGTPEEVIQQGTPDDPAVVDISETDQGFSSSRCREWTAN
jgi:hypothetical protein